MLSECSRESAPNQPPQREVAELSRQLKMTLEVSQGLPKCVSTGPAPAESGSRTAVSSRENSAEISTTVFSPPSNKALNKTPKHHKRPERVNELKRKPYPYSKTIEDQPKSKRCLFGNQMD